MHHNEDRQDDEMQWEQGQGETWEPGGSENNQMGNQQSQRMNRERSQEEMQQALREEGIGAENFRGGTPAGRQGDYTTESLEDEIYDSDEGMSRGSTGHDTKKNPDSSNMSNRDRNSGTGNRNTR
jgi:hypothetical protein